MKLFFDFFPIILFFAAFKLQGIYVATAVAIAASFGQIAWVWFRHRKVDTMLWVSLGVIVVFGGATLILHNETFIKWKPTVLYWLFASVLLVSDLLLNKNLMQAMMGKQFSFPSLVFRKLNVAWAIFFFLMGVANLYVAFNFSTDIWVNFKLFGGLGLTLVFALLQGFYLSKYINQSEQK
jgi:intracellular septation protein